MTKIVTVNVQTTNAPTPSKLQQTGAIVTNGGTTLAPGQSLLLTQPSDLTPYLQTPKQLTALSETGGQATGTISGGHGWPVGQGVNVIISGCVPTGYNGYTQVTTTSTTQFTYTAISSLGSVTTLGTIILQSAGELLGAVTSFFGQGSSTSVYVLEIGPNSVGPAISFFQNWLVANPNVYYLFVVPREFDAVNAYLTFLAGYENTTAKTYFLTTTTTGTYSQYTAQMKDVMLFVEALPTTVWPANALVSATSGGNITSGFNVVLTTTTAHGVVPGNLITITGCVPAIYNGTWIAQSGTGSNAEQIIISLPNVGTFPGALTTNGTLVASYYASSGIAGFATSDYIAPGAAGYTSAAEFDAAAAMQVMLSYNPSSTNKVPPLGYSFLYGVTPFPTQGNSSLIATLLAANVNLVGTGAEGGLSNTLLLNGTTNDGNPFNYWYAIDWAAINLDINVSNAIINGSNNNINPLYLNQAGINSLQAVCAQTMTSGVTFGLVLNPVVETELSGPAFGVALDNNTHASNTVVNAVPFSSYYAANPGQYKTGQYDGFAIIFAPLRGFENVIINLDATTFVA